MPANIVCDGCDLKLLGLDNTDPEPIGHDNCPNCGGADFSFTE